MTNLEFLRDESNYYDRVFLKKMYQNGFSLNNDLKILYQMINQLTKYNNLSKQARNRLKWFDYYKRTNNVSLTCRHYDISRKTFYKWKKKYNPSNLYTLEDTTTRPKNFRKPEITNLQEEFIQLGNYTNDTEVFNRDLTDWLIEYNFHRPHISLNYKAPINFNNSERVLPRYPSCTKT